MPLSGALPERARRLDFAFRRGRGLMRPGQAGHEEAVGVTVVFKTQLSRFELFAAWRIQKISGTAEGQVLKTLRPRRSKDIGCC
jgi:hypothetical protein